MRQPLRSSLQESAAHVAVACGQSLLGLRRRVESAFQQIGGERSATNGGERAGEQHGLVEAALTQPCGMERQGNDAIGVDSCPIRVSSWTQPRGEREPVAVFEILKQAVERIGVSEGGADAVEVRRECAGQAPQALPVGEGRAQCGQACRGARGRSALQAAQSGVGPRVASAQSRQSCACPIW